MSIDQIKVIIQKQIELQKMQSVKVLSLILASQILPFALVKAESMETGSPTLYQSAQNSRGISPTDFVSTELFGSEIDSSERRLSSEKEHLMSHKSEFDQICVDYDASTNTCMVTDKQIRLTHDTYYATEKSIILDGAKISCVTPSYVPCTIQLHLKGNSTSIELRNGSKILGKQVIIQAPDSEVRIYDNSTLWVSGQSTSINGTHTNSNSDSEAGQSYKQVGASFIAQGGGSHVCSSPDAETQASTPSVLLKEKTYGEFDMVPDSARLSKIYSQIGSCGQQDDIETAGGGRVVVIADSLTLDGNGTKISADGRPYADFQRKAYSLAGGSGGYVYLATANKAKNNTIGLNCEISAKGGLGIGEHGGGSGGVVVLDDQLALSSIQVHVGGGQADANATEDGCMNGGAGTIYHRFNDTLVVTNEIVNTTSFTMLKVPPQKELVDGKFELAKKMYIVDGARMKVAEDHEDLIFDELYIWNYGYLQLSKMSERVHLHISNITYIGSSGTLDFSGTRWVGIYPADNATAITLGTILYSEFIAVQAYNSSVSLVGPIKLSPDVKDTYKPHSKVIIQAANITIVDEINAGYTFMHSNESMLFLDGSKINSLTESTCNQDLHSQKMFTCLERNSLLNNFTAETIAQSYARQFQSRDKSESFSNVLMGLKHNYTAFLMSDKEIKMFGAEIQGPRIGICAGNLTVSDSQIETSGLGCQSDQGLGRGHQYGNCAGSGGALGTSGGQGGVLIMQGQNESSQTKCRGHVAKGFTEGKQMHFEGSGGASGKGSQETGGAGGGIIRLEVLGTINLERSQVHANGLSGSKMGVGNGSGGGSGGSISILTRNLKGESTIEAQGGDGSEGGGGGGSGGQLTIHFLDQYSAEAQPNQSQFWQGTHSITGGLPGTIQVAENESAKVAAPGEEGLIQKDKCFGGYSGPFCQPCPAGFFKFNYSYGTCQPCQNKPLYHSSYTDKGASNANCPYQCDEGFDPVEINPLCLNAFEIQITRAGGAVSTMIGSLCILTFALIMWISLIVQSKMKLHDLRTQNQTIFDKVLFKVDQDISSNKNLVQQRHLAMRDEDIWSHSHRLYLLGDNSMRSPWQLTKDFPITVLDQKEFDQLIEIIDERQNGLDWSPTQKDCYFASLISCPCLSKLVHKFMRKRHFDALQDEIHRSFSDEFWDQNGNTGKTIRVQASIPDYQLAYIDFLDYSKSRQDYIGPALPVTLLVGGRGTYQSPYQLDFENDALAKSIVYLNKQTLEKLLPTFYRNLNTLMARLSFQKTSEKTVADLLSIVEWIDLANKTLFYPLDTKATMYLFESSYENTSDQAEIKQQRKSFPMEQAVFESFPEVLKALVQFAQSRLHEGNSEIRFGLVFEPFDPEDKKQLMNRIRSILAKNKYNMLNCSSRQSMVKNLIYGEMSIGEETSSSFFQNTNLLNQSQASDKKDTNVIDDSLSSFDLSNKAIQDLEMSLHEQKIPRCVSIKHFIYAKLLQFFRYKGLPSTRGSQHPLFFAYAAISAVDLLLTMILCIHILYPISDLGTIGVPFLFIFPLTTILGPLLGPIACLIGSSRLLQLQSNCNCLSVLMNYPLTMVAMIYFNSDPFYKAVVILLCMNKTLVSYTSCKIVQHWQNPGFTRNFEKMQENFASLIQAQIENKAGITPGMSAKERASNFVNSGLPQTYLSHEDKQKMKELQFKRQASLGDSDEDDIDEDEDDTSFGIIPKSRLLSSTDRQSMSEF